MGRTTLWDLFGLLRSVGMYYAHPRRDRQQVQFYSAFIQPGDLCFDIGAHVGSRLRLWTRLSARIIAVEPQPLFMRFLRLAFGRRPNVVLVEAAVGALPGEQEIFISRRTPTVTSLSTEWIASVRQIDSFSGYQWEGGVRVPVRTLDGLIAEFGEPDFCKIDVEGYELEILKGLSRPLDSLSFEYIPAAVEIAIGCVRRLESLDRYTYNYSQGETPRLGLDHGADAGWIIDWLNSLAKDGPSGDIYACRI